MHEKADEVAARAVFSVCASDTPDKQASGAGRPTDQVEARPMPCPVCGKLTANVIVRVTDLTATATYLCVDSEHLFSVSWPCVVEDA